IKCNNMEKKEIKDREKPSTQLRKTRWHNTITSAMTSFRQGTNETTGVTVFSQYGCNPELRVFLKEREFSSATEMAEAADRYRSAHLYRGKSEKFSQHKTFFQSKDKSNSSEVVCHGCGKTGHIKPNCPDNPRNFRGMKIPSQSCPDDPNPATVDVATLRSCTSPDPCDLLEEPDLCDLPKLPSPHDLTEVPDKPSSLTPTQNSKVCSESYQHPIDMSMVVQTRASNNKTDVGLKLKCPTDVDIEISKASLIKAQKSCITLKSIREKVESGKEERVKSRSVKYEIFKDLIYRVCIKSKNIHEIGTKQLVVPEMFRNKVLSLAHDSLTGGHFSHRKTSYKVYQKFFWPGVGAEIKRYCKSCHICQKVSAKGSVSRVPMKSIPVVAEPFSRVAIDIVGPISPCSDRGHKYILTLIDYATRFPEAVPLKKIDSITIAESLVEIFARVGIPKEMLSDRGTQFRSDLMAEVNRLLSIKALYTTPYHPSCNGAVERLNGILKSMLKKLCTDKPKDWDRSRLKESAKLAASNAEISSTYYKKYYDVKTKNRKLNVNDEVLVLLPSDTNKLIMQWRGPYPVTECKENGVDYLVNIRNKPKLFHINMLKQYHRRNDNMEKKTIVQLCVTEEICDKESVTMYFETTSCEDMNLGEDLNESQIMDVKNLIEEFSDVFSDEPGYTSSIEHVIKLETTTPISKKPYPIPHHLVDTFNKEIDKMLEMGIIEPSNSPYCSPVVLVKKADGTLRICLDFRGLNDVTIFDCEPMPTSDGALGL
ncbi:uncharacterized protein LOC122243473, partial [Penaeus japonicus]|uniref:uncharacterized protein LOC122243473 n=1 Tax=Penaeus japonicus TaxID=27405 RepID=UPI001C712C3F